MIGLILGLIFLGVCSPIVCAYRPRVDKLDIILPESPKISLKDLESHRDGTIWLAILGHVWDVSMGSKVRNAKNYENIDELPSNRGRYSSAGGVGGMSPLPGEMPTAPQFRSLMQFYGPGGSYEFFAGKDASRAYATGNFTDDLTDDLTGLSSEKLLSIVEWLAFYAESDYEHIGVLAGGAFFDDSGRQTDAYGAVFAAARALQEDEQKFLSSPDMANPHCTSRWEQGLGSSYSCDPGRYPRRILRRPGDIEGSACRCLDDVNGITPTRAVFEGCAAEMSHCFVPDGGNDEL